MPKMNQLTFKGQQICDMMTKGMDRLSLGKKKADSLKTACEQICWVSLKLDLIKLLLSMEEEEVGIIRRGRKVEQTWMKELLQLLKVDSLCLWASLNRWPMARISLDQGNMTQLCLQLKNKLLPTTGVYLERNVMGIKTRRKSCLALENTISSSSRSEWKWWKEFCNRKTFSRRRESRRELITTDLFRSCQRRQRASMLLRKKDTLWERSTWCRRYSRVLIKIFSSRAILQENRSQNTYNFLEQPTPKSKNLISLKINFKILGQVLMRPTNLLFSPIRPEGSTLLAFLAKEKMIYSVEMIIPGPKIQKKSCSLINWSLGPQTSGHSEQLKESLPASTTNRWGNRWSLVQEHISKMDSPRRSLRTRRLRDKISKWRIWNKVVSSLPPPSELLTPSLTRISSFTGPLWVSTMKKNLSDHIPFKEGHPTISFSLKITKVQLPSNLLCQDSQPQLQRLCRTI